MVKSSLRIAESDQRKRKDRVDALSKVLDMGIGKTQLSHGVTRTNHRSTHLLDFWQTYSEQKIGIATLVHRRFIAPA